LGILSPPEAFSLHRAGGSFSAKKFFSSGEEKSILPLFTNFQFLDQRTIAIYILLLEIIEEMAPLPYQFQQPSSRMVIFHMGLEMLGQIIDPFAEDGDLNLRRPRIRGMSPVSLDDGFFLLWQ
jgi:hypothetical protein